MAVTPSPDRERWGTKASYKLRWAERGRIAARFIRNGSRVLEIGTGDGSFRRLIEHRCRYTGTDLAPLDDATQPFDLDNDPMPAGSWDTIVLLGVLEYLHRPVEALRKVATVTARIVLSYCQSRSRPERRARGWVNALAEREILDAMTSMGFHLSDLVLFAATSDFEQFIFESSHQPGPPTATLRRSPAVSISMPRQIIANDSPFSSARSALLAGTPFASSTSVPGPRSPPAVSPLRMDWRRPRKETACDVQHRRVIGRKHSIGRQPLADS
jgi:SAM-dependent methyltransferase